MNTTNVYHTIEGKFGINYDYDTSSYKFQVDAEGICSARTFEVTSDVRLKNLRSKFNESGLNIINELPIYNYSFKNKDDQLTIGITAQDLQKVLPQLVDSNNPDHLKIHETKLVYICMQAIKELQKELEELKIKISEV